MGFFKFLFSVVLIIALAGFGTYEYLKVREQNAFILVDSPISGQTIAPPLTVSGRARGNWFFEATFPVQLTDDSGKILGAGQAAAKGDWQTSELVPFEAQIEFDAPLDTHKGFVILKKDNPSGQPENDAQVKIPVNFQ